MDKLKVLIVDDEDLLRMGLELVIQAEEDMTVVGAAANGQIAIELIKQAKPDIVLLDLQMPVMGGIECIREIRKLHTDLPILILTTFNEEEYIFRGLAYGANGYLLKGIDFKILVQTIRDAMNDQYVLPAAVAASIARYVLKNNTYMKERGILDFFEQNPQYTKKEQEIMLLLLNRLPNKEIATQLFFTEGTIKNKLTAIFDKLGVTNRQEAIQRLESLANV
ncbi:unnamed protein product [Aphanomyces euteiches]